MARYRLGDHTEPRVTHGHSLHHSWFLDRCETTWDVATRGSGRFQWLVIARSGSTFGVSVGDCSDDWLTTIGESEHRQAVGEEIILVDEDTHPES
jgi:hypothetical protein